MDPPKKSSTAPPQTSHDEGLEFELTDLSEARRILDDESVSQFYGATTVSPEQWKRLRRSTLPTDRALSGQAIDWLLGLPPNLRPDKLTSQFPRLANALAEAWHEPDECHAALVRLLGEERTGRSGFPPDVRHELIALRDWTQAF